MADEWFPWVEHDGRGCPLTDGTIVRIELADGRVFTGTIKRSSGRGVDCWQWHECKMVGKWEWRVVRYRLRKLRGMVILKNLLTDLPERVDA